MPFEVWAYFEPFKKDNNKFGRCKVKVDNNGVESLCGAQISEKWRQYHYDEEPSYGNT